MTISHVEFFRLLPIALTNLDYQIEKDRIEIQLDSGTIQIVPGDEQQRKIASLVLPVLHVRFQFESISEESKTSFLNNFSKTYQRGGG